VDRRGRILALDYGERNIGLAYSDEMGLTVQPLPSIPNSILWSFVKKLQNVIRTLNIQEMVLGIPLNMDGTLGDAARRMEQIMVELRSRINLPLTGIDERLSTVEALEIWKSLNQKQQKKYRTVDSLAAALILERYLRENQF
jgi:putative Holliday junction resolvase